MTERILLVDDERDIIKLIEGVLRKDGFSDIKRAYNGSDALRLCREFIPDAIVLDVMLPDADGVELCSEIRSFSHCLILFLSSKNDDVDIILGLASGGDDYVTKPFSPKELVYRVKSQLRRARYARADAVPEAAVAATLGPLSLDSDASIAYKNGAALELTAKEYGLLKYLMENPNRIISKERLYEQVWGEESAVCDNTIMVHIRHLREKIEQDASRPRMLVTVKGLGYKLLDGERL